MLRMRLRRVGAKKQPRYRVVIAEARAPRDGDFVENIGFYDPLTEPATVRIDRDKALDWISKGAQPSDTVHRLLRGAGILEGGAVTMRTPVAAPILESPASPADSSVVAPPETPTTAPVEVPATAQTEDPATLAAEEPADGDPAAK